MTFFQSIILGIVQGFTEFLPVSSSAHLCLTKWLMGVPDGEHLLYFDLICHNGTLLALILFLRKDILATLKDRKAIALFALALFPLVPAYFLLKPLRIAASDPAYLGYFLMFTSLLLFFASRKTPEHRERDNIHRVIEKSEFGQEASQIFRPEREAVFVNTARVRTENLRSIRRSQTRFLSHDVYKLKDVLCIGMMQAMALIPGISRSGSTIATGRLLGWDWVAAARFSFLLAIPAILGGQAIETLKLLREPIHAASPVSLGCYAAGFCTSFAIGMVGVRFMFKIYEKGWVRPFAWYCLSAGLLAVWVLHG